MNKSIEQTIKEQYSKIFEEKDWRHFKKIAEYYFETAATLRKKDIPSSNKNMKLLIRNTQKRLFLGVGCELLVKSCYLKSGYFINKLKKTRSNNLIQFNDREVSEFNEDNTMQLDFLIKNLNQIIIFKNWQIIETGLKILKVYRNKEVHITSKIHAFNEQDYRGIEKSIEQLYKEAFNETIEFRISMTENDGKGVFEIKK